MLVEPLNRNALSWNPVALFRRSPGTANVEQQRQKGRRVGSECGGRWGWSNGGVEPRRSTSSRGEPGERRYENGAGESAKAGEEDLGLQFLAATLKCFDRNLPKRTCYVQI